MTVTEVVGQVAAQCGIHDTAVFSFAGDTYAFLFLAYKPQCEGPLMVDNYYPAYQRVRHARLALQGALEAQYTTKEIAYGYKGLAVLSGKAYTLRNRLTAIDEFGSWFVMEAVCVEGVHAPLAAIPSELEPRFAEALSQRDNPLYGEAWYRLSLARMHPLCDGCDRCVRACPQGALSDLEGMERCFRSLQNNGYIEDPVVARRMGQRVLGCHTCQLACPVNFAPTVAAEVDGEALFKAAIEGKHALQPFADCLGTNYLRPARLASLCLNALTNAGDNRFRAQAIAARDKLKDERVDKAVDRYLLATPDVEREVKYMLDEQAFFTFGALAEEGPNEVVIQENHYFDTGDYARARIRKSPFIYDCVLTLKRRVSNDTLHEYSARVAYEDYHQCLKEGLTPRFVHRYLGLQLPATAPYEGVLTTTRTRWVHDGLTYELDASEYLGKVDFEIECEVTNDADWAKAEQFILSVAPTAHLGKSKYARFREAKKGSE